MWWLWVFARAVLRRRRGGGHKSAPEPLVRGMQAAGCAVSGVLASFSRLALRQQLISLRAPQAAASRPLGRAVRHLGSTPVRAVIRDREDANRSDMGKKDRKPAGGPLGGGGAWYPPLDSMELDAPAKRPSAKSPGGAERSMSTAAKKPKAAAAAPFGDAPPATVRRPFDEL